MRLGQELTRRNEENKFPLELVTGGHTFVFLFAEERFRLDFRNIIEDTIESLYTQDPRKKRMFNVSPSCHLIKAIDPPHERPEDTQSQEETAPNPHPLPEVKKRTTYRIRRTAMISEQVTDQAAAPKTAPSDAQSHQIPERKSEADSGGPREAFSPPSSSSASGTFAKLVIPAKGLWSKTISSGSFKPKERPFLHRPVAIREGTLRVKFTLGGSFEKRFCLLAEGVLHHYCFEKVRNALSSLQSNPLSVQDRTPEGSVFLGGFTLASDEMHHDFAFQLQRGSETFSFSADGREEQMEWVNALSAFCNGASG